MPRRQRITEWNPEDIVAWDAGNSGIARRNLIWSIVTAHVAFSIWYLWSVMALFMPHDVYGFSTGDKLLIGATASLTGAIARLPDAMAGARLGGHNWALFSSSVLLIPVVGAVALLAHPGLPLWPYLVCAALTGLGGANYSASLANAEAYYPQRLKGFVLGITGGIANLGSATVQAVGLLVLALAGHYAPYWVCAIYLVLLAVGGLGAAVFMDNLRYRVDMSHLTEILKIADSWRISLLYLCCSGSFIGFAFAFGQLLQHNFLISGQTHAQASLHAAEIAFIGPLLGSMARVAGGKLADHFGGGRVSLLLLIGMICGGAFLTIISTHDDLTRGPDTAVTHLTMIGYVAGFIWLFIFAGGGKAAVYKLIPSIFQVRSLELDGDETERRGWARVRSATLIGFAGAFGALGGVGINLVLRQSYDSAGTETPAFWIFLACYTAAAVVTWIHYVRPDRIPAWVPTIPHAEAGSQAAEPL